MPKVKEYLRQLMLKPKAVARYALAILSVVSLIVSYAMLDDYRIIDGEKVINLKSASDSAYKAAKTAGVDADVSSCSVTGNDDDVTVVTIMRAAADAVTSETRMVSGVSDEMNPVFDISEVLGLGAASDYNTAEQLVVEFTRETVKQTIKHGYKKVYSKQLEKGKTKVSDGKDGEKEVVYCTTVINGVMIDRVAESETVITEPVTEIETVGTKVVLSSSAAVMTSEDVKCISELTPSKPIELDASGKPVNYTNVIKGKATAYSSGSHCSTGVACKPGYVAVNPRQIPYGTKLYIVSADGRYNYGYAIAADTGGFATNGSGTVIDLRFNTSSECYSFGRRDVIIYVLG